MQSYGYIYVYKFTSHISLQIAFFVSIGPVRQICLKSRTVHFKIAFYDPHLEFLRIPNIVRYREISFCYCFRRWQSKLKIC